MTDSSRRESTLPGPSNASPDNISLASYASSPSPAIPDLSTSEALKQSSTLGNPDVSINRSPHHGGEFNRGTMDKRIRDVLALCDKVVASAIVICAQGNNSSDLETVHSLDDCLFELNIWVENVEATLSNSDIFPKGLRVLDVLRGSAAATVRQVISDLETTVKVMSKDLEHDPKTLSEEFHGSCHQIKTWVDQLDKLRNDLAGEITNQKGDIQNVLKSQHDPPGRKITVLCLDGGGIRSYSSLLVLRALMDVIRSFLAPETTSGDIIRPHEVFDYVFGSSSGGLIAIMLARLNMTDQQCLDVFQAHAENMFLRRQPLYRIFGPLYTTKYSSKSITKATKLVVGEFDPTLGGQKWKRNMFAAPNARCRCGVIAYAMSSKSNREKTPLKDHTYLDQFRILRTYNNPSGVQNPGPATDHQIWQVAQATSAAPNFFPPVKVDGEELLDGGFGVNNPSHMAAEELSTIYDTNDICLVSIGSGRYRSPSRTRSSQFGRLVSLLQTAIEFMTDAEKVHRQMFDIARMSERFSYFRFDVPGLEHIAMDQLVLKKSGKRLQSEEKHTIAFIRAHTQEYLQRGETHESIKSCARMIIESRCRQQTLSPRSGQNTSEGNHRHLNNVLIPRNNTFCGREEILQNMRKHLGPSSRGIDSRLQTCFLYGLGGIGKTQIAAEYCYRYRREYDGIFWIRASTEANVAKGYRSILDLIEPDQSITDTNQAISVVNQWLSNTESQWLLIFDEAEYIEDFMRYLPASSHGSVIVTSRSRDISIPGSLEISVEPLDSETGAKLLGSLNQVADLDNSAKELVDLLGGHPLAICQAAAYMRSAAISCSKFLQLYKKRPHMSSHLYNSQIKRLFRLNLASLSTEAQRLLECMALMDPDQIPEELFLQDLEGVEIIEKFDVTQAELLTFSFVQRQNPSQPHTYRIHRFLSRFIFEDLIKDPPRCLDSLFTALRLIRGVIPRLQPHMHQKDVEVYRDLFQRYIPHIRSLNETHERFFHIHDISTQDLDFAGLLSDLVLYLLFVVPIGSDNLAQRLCEKVIKIQISALGQEHQDTLASQFNLVLIFESLGQLEQAEQVARETLSSRREVLGSTHPDTLTSFDSLASICKNLGKFEEAEQIARETLSSRVKVLGSTHPDTLTNFDSLALICKNLGKFEEAEQITRETLRSRKKILGSTHLDTLTNFDSLALICKNLGKLEEAEQIARNTLTSRRITLGQAHSDTLTNLANVASILRGLRKLEEAEKFAREALDLRESILGPYNLSTISSMADLALVFLEQGQYSKAKDLQIQVLRLHIHVLGADHPDTLATKSNLFRILAAQGQTEEIGELVSSIIKKSSTPVVIPRPKLEYPQTKTQSPSTADQLASL